MKPRLLDLFCGAGGATRGYQLAGFHVTGVDVNPQPNYCGDDFWQMDAVGFLRSGWESGLFDVVHASPPCQLYSVANNIHGNDGHPDLLPITRELLKRMPTPWVIENVPGAPMENYVVVCGLALGCGVKRHRWFESSEMLIVPACPEGHKGDWVSVFGHTVLERGHVIGKAKGGGNTIKRRHLGIERGRSAMGIDWMNRKELSEAIPPAYTEYIGRQLMEAIR